MALRLCVAVALCMKVAVSTHREAGRYGNYGTTDSGPFWNSQNSEPGVTQAPQPPRVTRSPVPRTFRQGPVSYGSSRQQSTLVRGPFSQRYHLNTGQRSDNQRPFFRFSTQQFQRGHSKMFVSRASVTTQAPPVFGRSSNFLQMLRDRQTALRNEQDQQRILYYLLELFKLRNLMGVDSDASLDSQIDLIDGIKNNIIKREVLKIFVKDMVERSGFLRRNVTAQDVQTIGALIDRINLITSEITVARQVAELGGSPDDLIDMLPALAAMQQARNTLPNFNSISNRRPSMWNNRRLDSTRRGFVPRPGDNQRLMNFDGRRREPVTQPPLSGLSVFGNFAGDGPRVLNRETTTATPTTTQTKRGMVHK